MLKPASRLRIYRTAGRADVAPGANASPLLPPLNYSAPKLVLLIHKFRWILFCSFSFRVDSASPTRVIGILYQYFTAPDAASR